MNKDLASLGSRVIQVRDDFLSRYEIEESSLESFLFQTGYLTIKKTIPLGYELDFPNKEVTMSFNDILLETKFSIQEKRKNSLLFELLDSFDKEEFPRVFRTLQSAISSIPYNLFIDTESYYHSIISALLWSTGLDVQLEDMVSTGRSDIVVKNDKAVWVLELKTTSLSDAMKQLLERNYHKKFLGTRIYLVGILISFKKRNLETFEMKTLEAD